MKNVRNKTHKPIKIALPGGKFLHLGPGKTGQVSDQAWSSASFQKLVESGDIEPIGEDSAVASGGESSTVHESTHGHAQPKVVLPKGDR